jgi:hypothetical protein
MLQNPAYMGKAAYGKTEQAERRNLLRPIRNSNPIVRRVNSTHRDKPVEQSIYIDVPAIVLKEVFQAAKKQLQRNKRLSKRHGRGEKYLLQGLTVCSCCGYAYYGKTASKSAAKGARRYAYYRYVGGDGYRFAGGWVCHNTQVRVEQLDGYVWETIKELMQHPERLQQEWSRRSRNGGIAFEQRKQRDESARIVAIQEHTLKRLLVAYEAGIIELEELKSRSDAVRRVLGVVMTPITHSDAPELYIAAGKAVACMTFLSRAYGQFSIIKSGPPEIAADAIRQRIAVHASSPDIRSRAEQREVEPVLTFQIGLPLGPDDLVSQGKPEEHNGLNERLLDKHASRAALYKHYISIA